jgi:hypothetical protein
MSTCIRCDKYFPNHADSIHTCTPSPIFREGIIEGLNLILEKLNSINSCCSDADMFWIDTVNELITQHSEKS